MEIPEELLCLFSAEVEADDETYRIEIPVRELTDGDLQAGEVSRIALLASGSTSPSQETSREDSERRDRGPPIAVGGRPTVDIGASRRSGTRQDGSR